MDPFLGELRIMPYGGPSANYIPNGWAPCNGQLLAISQNSALFALLGTMYGGNGQTTFALPDLRGRAVVGQGQGAGLSNYQQGNVVGTENVTLLTTQLPTHNHPLGTPTVAVSGAAATATSPAGGFFTTVSPETFGSGTGNGPMAANMVNGPTSSIGGSQPHNNQMPYIGLAYYIATQGIFPARQ